MKIRSGFVSNSSSSSFILVGVKINNESLLNNPEYKAQLEKELEKEQLILNSNWEKILNHSDFDKYKTLYETCKSNNVSIPQEVSRFFGWGFKGVFEPDKAHKSSILSQMIDENEFKFPKGIEVLSDEGPTYLGKIMATSSEEYLDNGSISMEQLKEYTEILINMGFNEKEVKIYYGTRAC